MSEILTAAPTTTVKLANRTLTKAALDVAVCGRNAHGGHLTVWRRLRLEAGRTQVLAVAPAVMLRFVDEVGRRSSRFADPLGQVFDVRRPKGGLLDATREPGADGVIIVRSLLESGVIQAEVLRDDLPCSLWSVFPQQQVVFDLDPRLWFGVLPGAQPGTVLEPKDADRIDTPFDLNGLASAELALTGAGTAEDPYVFELEKAVRP